MLLATDLDGTFLSGSSSTKEQLYSLISSRSDIQLIFVTGRHLTLITPLLGALNLAEPDYIICDVGATVVDCYKLPVEPLQSHIDSLWPGEERVAAAMSRIPGLVRQQQPQSRRCSYLCTPEALTENLKRTIEELNCDLLFSADCYLDVLPRGVNKGSTLARFIEHFGINPTSVLVAGDTLNDLSMYQQGFKGVCVGDSEPALLHATQGQAHVFHALRPGCGGILDAMHHFALL